MATYCPASRRHSPPAATSSAPHLSSQSRHSLIDLTDSPTYIFPDPSSVLPSPNMSPSSHFSEWSDVSASVISFSELGSAENSPFLAQAGPPIISGSRQPLSPSESLGPWTDVQGLGLKRLKRRFADPIPPEPAAEISDRVYGGMLNSDASSFTLRSVNSETIPSHLLNYSRTVTPLIPGDKQQQSLALQQTPFAHSSIPLLSLFASLLGVDDLTLDLLTLPTSPAPLFLPMEKCFDIVALNEVETPTTLHGLEKLFSDTHTEIDYRHGLLSHEEMPVVRPVVLPSVQFMITAFVSNGWKVLHHFSNRLTRTTENPGMN